MDTLRDDVPPIGSLPGVDLVAEGILTLHKAIAIIEEVDGDYSSFQMIAMVLCYFRLNCW